jgi:hypothetical protein
MATNRPIFTALLALAAAATVQAEPTTDPKAPKTNLLDHSTASLIDPAGAMRIVSDNIPAKVWKLYPASKYSFVSQVEGGITANGTCVVTARLMLLPVTPTMKAVLFRPQKTATAFEAVPASSREQCQALARDKLKEATTAVVSSLVKT